MMIYGDIYIYDWDDDDDDDDDDADDDQTLNGFHKPLTTQGGGFVSFGGQEINLV